VCQEPTLAEPLSIPLATVVNKRKSRRVRRLSLHS
jgi:hypothetical protein